MRAIKSSESHLRDRGNDVKKINIFEQEEGDLMKNDALARFRY